MYQRLHKMVMIGVAVALLLLGCATSRQRYRKQLEEQLRTKYGVVFPGETEDRGTWLEMSLRDLVKQIVSSVEESGKKKVAVLEFSDLDGRVTNFGMYLAEELITRLFKTKRFEVVERQLLNKVLTEQKLFTTGLIDPNSAKRLGRILGVDAIVSGTITDLGRYLKVNARIISTETGKVFAVAATRVIKDDTVKELMSRVSKTVRPTVRPVGKSTKKVGVGVRSVSEKVFFKEDFSDVPEGMIPEGWIGGEKLLVKADGRRKYLTDFEKQHVHKVTIADVKFPENFELRYTFQFGGQAYDTRVVLYVGIIRADVDVRNWYILNAARVDNGHDWRNKVVRVALSKEG